MANASPIASNRFSAKIVTSVTQASARSTAIEPKIAIPPTANGIAAARNPPNTHTSTRKLTGIAMVSITFRSFRVWLVICASVMACPPARTVTPSRLCTTWPLSVSACWPAALLPPVMLATIRPTLPSLLINAADADGGAVQGEVTRAT